MDFDFSPEQYGMRDEARRFLAERSPTSSVRAFIDEPAAWSRELWKQMASIGWTGLPFAEEHGGLGQSFLDLVLLLGELGRAVAPVPYLSSVAMAGMTIARQGSDEQRARWLPGIASGERVACLALRDPSEVTVRARGGRLEGEVRPVLDAPAADLFVVAADAGDGARWFVAEEASSVTPLVAYDRTRTLGVVTLDGVPAEPLAVPGLEPGLRIATAAVCAEMIGTAEAILEMSVDYAKVREQFGRPIGSFQAIKHKLADMLTELEAARAAVSYACWAVATDAPDAALAASVAKSYCSDALAHLGGEGVQAHGGIAFTWEHDMHLFLRRIKSTQVLLGDAAYHRERVAQIVGL